MRRSADIPKNRIDDLFVICLISLLVLQAIVLLACAAPGPIGVRMGNAAPDYTLPADPGIACPEPDDGNGWQVRYAPGPSVPDKFTYRFRQLSSSRAASMPVVLDAPWREEHERPWWAQP